MPRRPRDRRPKWAGRRACLDRKLQILVRASGPMGLRRLATRDGGTSQDAYAKAASRDRIRPLHGAGGGHLPRAGGGPVARAGAAQHPDDHDRRRRLLECRRLQPRHDGADAQHRPHRARGDAVHRPLRGSDLYARPRRLHHRPVPRAHRAAHRRPAGLADRHRPARPDARHRPAPAGLRHRAGRQEPPRRPQPPPADGERLRHLLRQPLPPEHRGGARGS